MEGCIRVKEQAKDYSGAVRYRMSVRLRVGLALAAKYVRQGLFQPNQRIEGIALSYARKYAQKKDKEKLLSIIDCIMDVSLKVSLLKQATLFVKAAELLASSKQYYDAFRILSAQGEHKRGIELATELKDNEAIRFVLQSAVAQLARDGSINDCYVLGKLEDLSTHADPRIKAKASLLLGRSLKVSDPTKAVQQFRKAYNIYKSSYPNKVGEIESFCLISELKMFQCNVSSIQFAAESVETARAATEVAKSLRIMTNRTASAIHTVHRAEEFYGFQKVPKVYYLPQDQDIWLEKLKSCSTLDEDGMMNLDEEDTLCIVAEHLEHYIVNWVDHDETLKFKLRSFTFYGQLVEQEHLTHSYRSFPPEQLKQFLDICFMALDLESVCKSETFHRVQRVLGASAHQSGTFLDVRTVLLRMLSPLNTLYLPLDRNTHFSALGKSVVASQVLQDKIGTILSNYLEDVKVDDFLQVWKLNSILGVIDQAGSSLRSLLQLRTYDANNYYRYRRIKYHQTRSPKLAIQQYPHGPWYPPPYAFTYNSWMDKYQHYFFFWIESCRCIRQGKVITAVKMSMDYFICVVARRRSLRTDSVANLISILSVHSTALFATLSFSGHPRTQRYNFIVPQTFKYAVESFNELNCQLSDDQHVLVACARNVQKEKSFKKLESKAFDLLWRMLDVLLGRYREYYHVLRDTVSKTHCIESGEALHCLVLTLTLLGNMALEGCNKSYVIDCRRKIYEDLKWIPKPTGECGRVLVEVREILAYCTDVSMIFRSAILKLLTSVDSRNAGFLTFSVHKKWQSPTVQFDDIPSHRVPQKALAPLLQRPAPTPHAQRTAGTPPNLASKLDQDAEAEQHFQEDPVDPEQPQLASNPVNTPEEPETIDDNDEFDDDEINDILEDAEKIEILPDNKAEKEIKEDESLTDEKCCIPCGKLISTSYEAHCESEDHQQNSQLHHSFKEAEKEYSRWVSALQIMLAMCQKHSSLRKITIAIRNMLRKTGQRIEEIKQKYDWKEGKSEIEKETTSEMHSLFKQAEAELHSVESEENDDDGATGKGDVDSDSESELHHDVDHINLDLEGQKQRKGRKQGTAQGGKKSRK